MVRRKRRSSSVTNPRRRRNRRRTTTALVAAPRRRHAYLKANPRRRRRPNPGITRRRNRRRNPSAKGIVMGALWAGGGAALTNLVAGFIPIGGGGWMDIIKQGVAAYAVGFLAERFTSPANAQLMAIGGFAGTAWSAVNMLFSGASGFLTGGGHAAAQPAAGGGVGYLGDITTYPPGSLSGYDGMGDIVPAPDFYNYQAMN